MVHQTPLDELQWYISQRSENDISAFFEKYKVSGMYSHPCAMALHIAILGNAQYQDYAKNVFLTFAGRPKLTGGQPALTTQPTHIGTTLINPTYSNSAGYEAVVYVLAAFFNSFWSRTLCTEQKYNAAIHAQRSDPLPQLVQAGVAKTIKPPETVVASRWDRPIMESMAVFLKGLQVFFRKNPQFVPAELPQAPIMPNNPMYRQTPQSNNQVDLQAQFREDTELYQLSLFISRALDACNFLLIISSFFPTISPDLPQDARNFLLHSHLRDLICTQNGQNVATLLVELVAKYASNRGMDVSNLSNSLLVSCPSFFSQLEKTKATADDMLNKAQCVPLSNAIAFEPSIQALEYLQPALRGYLSIVPKFDLADIPDRFIALSFYPGVLELCFTYADALDPTNKASKYFFSDAGQKQQDTEGARLYNERRNCYAHIIKVFDTLKSTDDMLTEESHRREELASEVKNMIFYHAINSKDELFHFEFYSWYFSRGKGQEVVLMDTPFVEKFLQLNHRDFLALYYIRLLRYEEAADILSEQAELPDMTIDSRVDNLSRAVSALNASPRVDVEQAREIQDKLDVALVQHRIFDMAQNDEVRAKLQRSLYNLEQLYALATEARLKEGQLLVLSAANYKDEERVNHLWNEIVNETFLDKGDVRAVVAKVNSLITSMSTKTNDYIPLSLLLDSLERISVESQQDPTLVFKLLVGGSPMTEPLNLWLEYNDLLKRVFWTENKNKLHLYGILVNLLELMYRPNIHWSQERNAAFASIGLDTKINDIISGLGMIASPLANGYRERLQTLHREIFRK